MRKCFHYIRLMVHNSPGLLLAVAVVLLITAGVLLRILFCFPAHLLPLTTYDADSTLAGLCAFEINDGNLPLFFPGGIRLGPFSCYATAGMFTLFGPNRIALGATSVLFGTFFLIFMYLALSEAGGSKAALVSLLVIVLPPLQFWLSTYPTLGYIEIMAFSAAVLWLGLRLLLRPSDSRLIALLYGVMTGLALWSSVQSLMISGPITLMLILHRSLPLRSAIWAAFGSLTGAAPYLVIILRDGLAPFNVSFATRPVTSLEQVASNFIYLWTVTVPWLLFSKDAAGNFFSSTTRSLIQASILIATVVALFVAFMRRERATISKWQAEVVAIILLVILFSSGLFSISSAGSVRGWTVRYALPVYLVIPFIFLMLYARVQSTWGRLIVVLSVGVFCLLNCLTYPMFFDTKRQQELKLAEKKAVINWLYNTSSDVIVGDYDTVYSINFDSQRRIRALPTQPHCDYLSFGDRIEKSDLKIVLFDRDPHRLRDWMQNADLTGNIKRLTSDFFAAVINKPVRATLLKDIQLVGEAKVAKTDFSSILPDPLASLDSSSDRFGSVRCSLDEINGVALTAPITIDRQAVLRLAGWIADTENDIAPEQVFIQLRSAKISLYAVAHTNERPDVASYFHRGAIKRSGFMQMSSIKSIPPDKYQLSILQVDHGMVRSCKNVYDIVIH